MAPPLMLSCLAPGGHNNKQRADRLARVTMDLVLAARLKSRLSPSPPCLPAAAVAAESDAMPGRIPDPSVTAGSLPSLGALAGISAAALADKLKFGDLHEFGAMLSPLHFLDGTGKRALVIKTEVRETAQGFRAKCGDSNFSVHQQFARSVNTFATPPLFYTLINSST